MKKWVKVLFCIAFSFMFCFIGVGYASTSDILVVQGSTDLTLPKSVYITNVFPVPHFSGTVVSNGFAHTVLNSKTTLVKNDATSTAVISVTVYNNADEVYGYNATKYTLDEAVYDNANIAVKTNLDFRTPIDPGESLSFDVEFSYAEGADLTDNVLNSILTFEFLPISDISINEEEIVVKGTLDKFLEILNDPTDYATITNAMDANYQTFNPNHASYIGNVIGAQSDDTEIIETLFDGSLTLNINGKDELVTTLIKRENVDNNERTGDDYSYGRWWSTTVRGCEMTIYLTNETIGNYKDGDLIVVYAAVFTKDANGTQWYQIGDMYEGTAEVIGYDGSGGNDSFTTDTWKSVNGKTIKQEIAAVRS